MHTTLNSDVVCDPHAHEPKGEKKTRLSDYVGNIQFDKNMIPDKGRYVDLSKRMSKTLKKMWKKAKH